jgi:hypothetical protein
VSRSRACSSKSWPPRSRHVSALVFCSRSLLEASSLGESEGGGRRYQDGIPVNGTRDIEISAQSDTSPRSSPDMLNHLMTLTDPIVRGENEPPHHVYLDDRACYAVLVSKQYTNQELRVFWSFDFDQTGKIRTLLPSSISQHRRKTTAGMRNASYGTADCTIHELDDPEANMKHPSSVLTRRFGEHILSYRCVHPHRRSDTPLEFKRSLGPRVYARTQRVGHSALWATTLQHRRQHPAASRFARRSRSEASSTPSTIFEPEST